MVELGAASQAEPDVSVVLPTYNEAGHIVELLAHIGEKLTAADLSYEIVVVDDDSPDRTWQRAMARSHDDPRVRCHEAFDVAAAVDLAAQKAGIPRSRVAIVAESMGAGSAVMALPLIPDVGPMVLDSVYTSARTVVNEYGPTASGLPDWFTPGMVLMARTFFDLDVDAVAPIQQVRAHPERAFLFIQCDHDQTVLPHHGAEMKAASANAATELWVVPGCGHVKAFATHPAEWEARAVAFLEGQLGK